MVRGENSLPITFYLCRPFGEVRDELEKEGVKIEKEVILTPPFPSEPLGELYLISIKGKNAYLVYENYFSPKREPRSREAYNLVKGEIEG